MTILLGETVCRIYAEHAHALLVRFVEHDVSVYGPEFLTYNLHGLVHFIADAKRFGTLNNVSSFPFENYLSLLKKLIRKSNLQLHQVLRRFSE